MPQPNGKTAQGHWTVAELIAKARVVHTKRYHWKALDIDVLIRPRTHEENARGVSESQVLAVVAGEDGTVDPHGYLRVELRGTLPCILHLDGTPMFDLDDVEAMMEMDTPSLNEIKDEVTRVSNWDQEKAEEVGNDSGETDENSTSSASPSEPETPESSPTPLFSTSS